MKRLVLCIAASLCLVGCCRSECPPCPTNPETRAGRTVTDAAAVSVEEEQVARAEPEPVEVEPAEPEPRAAGAAEEPDTPAAPSEGTPREPEPAEPSQEVAEPGPTPPVVRVALYRAPGVSVEALLATEQVLRESRGFDPVVVTPEEVREGALDGRHVVIFTGGRGSVQGRLLGPEGRQIVREFVAAGGGYIGVCAGAYLAIQGRDEFHKIAIVAAENLSGDFWRRGVGTARVQEVGGEGVHRLFYANGPVFLRSQIPGFRPYVALATFLSDFYLPAHGTESGQMPSTPAILAASYHRGRIVLFSPNPVLSAEGEEARGDMMADAVRWVATPGPVTESLTFDDVFVSSP